MPEIKEFKLPDVGEGLVEADIVTWRVKPGDHVKVNTMLVDIETAKSVVELPSPFEGVVRELLFEEGQTVDVGTPIITVEVGAGAGSGGSAGADGGSEAPQGTDHPGDDMVPRLPDGAQATEVSTAAPDEPVEPGMAGGPAEGPKTLVGYGPRAVSSKRRARRGAAGGASQEVHEAFSTGRQVAQPVAPPREPQRVTPVPAKREGASLPSAGTPAPAPIAPSARVLAKPPVRKLAKDLGIDLAAVPATGPQGTVTRDDVMAFQENGSAASAPAGASAAAPRAAAPGERETRVPVKGVRKVTAQAMVTSAFTAPHVTEFLTVDVTRTMRLVERLKADREFAGVKVSPLLVVAKALLLAVRRNPEINASWDEDAQEIVVKHYVNLGIAAATPRGLVVPNVKDAQDLTLRQLADALAELTATAKEGRTQPAEMADGTISITNVGVFGVDTGTPILPPGESAILCFGAVRQQPWVHKGKVKPRWVTQLALSFDHRLVDGDLGSRFLADVGAVLERPEQALVWG
ncbi:dihydrolipoamide acetyltransferase family protein [Thalassiella azotivora]